MLGRTGAPFRKPHSGMNVAELTAALHRSPVPMIRFLSRGGYNDLLAGQADLRELCTRIELPEPSDELTTAVLAQQTPQFEQTYGVQIPGSLLPRIAALTSSYLLSERQPAKSVKVLRLACENARFDRVSLIDLKSVRNLFSGAFRGRPRGRRVVSRPSRSAVRRTQASLPNGRPREWKRFLTPFLSPLLCTERRETKSLRSLRPPVQSLLVPSAEQERG